MSTEQNKASFRRLYDEVFNRGNLDVADELIAPTVIEHQPQPGVAPDARGAELVKQIATFYRSVFPDLQIEIEDVVAEGDRVAGRLRIKGTQQGELLGIPATGNAVNVGSMDIMHYQDGKVVEHWGVTDIMAMMQQLGVMPTPEPAGA